MLSAASCAAAIAQPAWSQGQVKQFDVAAQPASSGIPAFAQQADIQVLASARSTAGKRTNAVKGVMPVQAGLEALLAGTGLRVASNDGRTILLDAGAARAQQSAAEAPSTVEDVIVTASRRDVAVQKLPMTVSAISAAKLDEMRARDTQDYIRSVPGVNFTDSGGGREAFVVRGVNSLGGSGTTARYIDETPQSTDLRLFDIDRVEVLRGPQGTLYGVSSMGGAIRTITRKPDLADFQVRVDGSALKTEHGGAGGDVNVAVNLPVIKDVFALRIVAYDERQPGFIDNYQSVRAAGMPTVLGPLIEKDPAHAEFKGGRIMARLAASSDVTVDSSLYYQDNAYNGLDSEDLDLGAGALRQSRRFNEAQENKLVQGNVTVNYHAPIGDLIASTSYVKSRNISNEDATDLFGPFLPIFNLIGFGNGGDTSGIQPLNLINDYKSRTFTQEVRLASRGDGRLKWLVGGFYSHDRLTGLQTIHAPHATDVFGAYTPGDSLLDFYPDQWQEEFSVFGEANYNLTPKLQITAGVRRYAISSGYDQLVKGLYAFDGTVESVATGVRDQGKASESGFTYKLMLSYQANDNLLFYGGASSGYRPGGPNQFVPPGQTPVPTKSYTSDKLWQYELGVKSTWWDGRLVANLSVFDIEWTDIQTIVATNGGYGFTANIGGARNRGAELELQLRPIDGLQLGAAFTYLDAVFQTPFASLGVVAGDPIPNVAKFQSNLSARYSRPLSADWNGFVSGEFSHVGKRLNSVNQLFVMPAYQTVNARIGVDHGDKEIALFVRNATDERGLIGLDNLGFLRRQYILPRTIGISVRSDF